MFYLFDTDDSIQDVLRRINALSEAINTNNNSMATITPYSNISIGVVGLRISSAPPMYAVYLWDKMVIAAEGIEEVA